MSETATLDAYADGHRRVDQVPLPVCVDALELVAGEYAAVLDDGDATLRVTAADATARGAIAYPIVERRDGALWASLGRPALRALGVREGGVVAVRPADGGVWVEVVE